MDFSKIDSLIEDAIAAGYQKGRAEALAQQQQPPAPAPEPEPPAPVPSWLRQQNEMQAVCDRFSAVKKAADPMQAIIEG